MLAYCIFYERASHPDTDDGCRGNGRGRPVAGHETLPKYTIHMSLLSSLPPSLLPFNRARRVASPLSETRQRGVRSRPLRRRLSLPLCTTRLCVCARSYAEKGEKGYEGEGGRAASASPATPYPIRAQTTPLTASAPVPVHPLPPSPLRPRPPYRPTINRPRPSSARARPRPHSRPPSAEPADLSLR